MNLNSRQVWSILDRYYSMRKYWPVSSPMGQMGGGSRVSSAGVTPKIAFVCDVGVALSKLEPQEREAVECAYFARHAAEEAESSAKNAERDSMRTSILDVRKMKQRSKREWLGIARDHRQALHRIYLRKAYKSGMPKLCALLSVVYEERYVPMVNSEVA